MKRILNVLIIEDDEVDVLWVKRALAESIKFPFHLDHVGLLKAALKRLKKGDIDAVLLDLGLPDISGLDAIKAIRHEVEEIPLILLTGQDDGGDFISQALQEGAQDYLIKGKITGESLVRCILYSVERNKLSLDLKKSNCAMVC